MRLAGRASESFLAPEMRFRAPPEQRTSWLGRRTSRFDAAVSQTFAFERTTTYEVVVWFFQTLASLFWISSVFVYGGFEAGDILQLLAAIAWVMSNAAALPNTLKLRPSSARSRDVELDAV